MPEIRTKTGELVARVTEDECAAYESEAALLNARNLDPAHARVMGDRPVLLQRDDGVIVDTFHTEAEAHAHKALLDAELLGSSEGALKARGLHGRSFEVCGSLPEPEAFAPSASPETEPAPPPALEALEDFDDPRLP